MFELSVLVWMLLGIPYVAVLAWVTFELYFRHKLKYNRAMIENLKELE